ncbi:Heterokaryon incompatibility protein 6, OR allele 4 [Paraphaeosphaeria sporulosa]
MHREVQDSRAPCVVFKIWPLAAAIELGTRMKPSTNDAMEDVCMALVGGCHRDVEMYLKDFAAMRLKFSAASSKRKPKGPGSLLPEGLSAAQEAAREGNSNKSMSKDGYMKRKRIFRTECGLIGSGPAPLWAGDVCHILSGGWVPFLLRPTGPAYRLAGEIYIDKVMQGEAVVDYMLLTRSRTRCLTLSEGL